MQTLADLQRGGEEPPATAAPRLPLEVQRSRTFDTPAFRGMTFLEVESRSVLNRVRGMPFRWSINLYRGCQHACTYCFARPSHAYLGLGTTADFDRTVVVKVTAPEVLRRELARPSWRGEHVAIGTNVDQYQQAEGRYRLMPDVIRALAEARTPFSILTKGTLITRDIPVLQAAARRVPVAASMTVGMLERDLWRRAEPGTPSPRARLAAVRRLNAAGIPTGVMLAPIMPGLNDDPAQLRALTEAAVEAGATHVTPITLHLRPGVKEAFWPWLESTYPHLVRRYGELYGAPGAGRGRTGLPVGEAQPPVAVVRRARDAAWRRRGGPPDPAAWPDRDRPGEQDTGHDVRPGDRPGGGADQLALFG